MNKFKAGFTFERAAIIYIKYLVEKNFWNKNHKEIEKHPFENSGGEIVATGEHFELQIKAYDWSNEKDGYLKFYHLGDLVVEFRWYKHCLRGLQVRYRNDDRNEAIALIEGCLEVGLEKIEER